MDVPRRLRFALRLDLEHKRVLDLGCGPGTYLRHFGPGSVGLDLDPAPAQREGLDARKWELGEGIPDELAGRFDAVWCSNLLEHVLAPHAFLIDIRRALAERGRLLVAVPQATRLASGPWGGYLAADHVNFFTPRTLAHTVARAGYQIDFLGNPSLPALRTVAKFGPTLMVIASPVPDFQYPDKAHKRLVNGRIEFRR